MSTLYFTLLFVISEVLFASVSKRVLVHSLSYGHEFDLENKQHASKINFHMKGCATGLVLKLRQKVGSGRFESLAGNQPPKMPY